MLPIRLRTLVSRDPQLNCTILSGGMAGDDINADGNFIAETTAVEFRTSLRDLRQLPGQPPLSNPSQ